MQVLPPSLYPGEWSLYLYPHTSPSLQDSSPASKQWWETKFVPSCPISSLLLQMQGLSPSEYQSALWGEVTCSVCTKGPLSLSSARGTMKHR